MKSNSKCINIFRIQVDMRKNNGRRRVRGQNRRNYNNISKNTVLESCGQFHKLEVMSNN